jgi:hypothetical protein
MNLRSVSKAFSILKAFRDSQEWVTTSELSRRCKVPRTTCSRLLQSLEDAEAVVRGPQGRYRSRMQPAPSLSAGDWTSGRLLGLDGDLGGVPARLSALAGRRR